VAGGQLWDLAPTALVALDAEHRVIAWNRAAEQLFGYRAAEVVGLPYPLVPDDHRATFARALGGAGESATAVPFDSERLHKSGRRLPVRIAVTRAGTSSDPIIIKSFADCPPVSARAALHESQERFRAFMDNTPLAAWEVDATGRIILANHAYAWFTGHRLAEVIGRNVSELFPPEQTAAYRAREEVVLATGQTQEWSMSFQRSNGTPCERFIIQFPVPGPAGQTLVGALALDLTEHHLLREQIYQQAQLISQGPQAVITCDPYGRIRSWNHGAELAFGYSTEQALDLDIVELLAPDPSRGIAERQQALLALLRTCDSQPSEAYLRRHSGELFFAQLQCRPLRDSEGAQLGLIAYVQDITQRTFRPRAAEGKRQRAPGARNDRGRQRSRWSPRGSERPEHRYRWGA
jgi:PAS domain S-box-containing protein